MAADAPHAPPFPRRGALLDGTEPLLLGALVALVITPILVFFVPGSLMYCQTLFVVLLGRRMAEGNGAALRVFPAIGAGLGIVWTVWHLAFATGPIPHARNPAVDFSWTADQDLNTVLFTGGMLAFVLATIGLAIGNGLAQGWRTGTEIVRRWRAR